MKTKEIENQIEELEKELFNLDIDLDIESLYNDGISFNDLHESLQESIYNEEVIYHHAAISYLTNNDLSLQESIGIAVEMGFNISGISSELLATLLVQQELFEQLGELYDDIERIMEQIEELRNELEYIK